MKPAFPPFCLLLLVLSLGLPKSFAEPVTTAAALVAAVRDRAPGSTIEMGPGVFELSDPLEPKAGMALKGAGTDKTILTHPADWKPSTGKLPDSEINMNRIDTRAYLIRLQDKAADIEISHLALRGPQMHGAVFGLGNRNARLHHLRFENVLYCGIRAFGMKESKIHDCEFIDAGGKWERGGIPGTDGGISGGAIFVIWMSDSEIAHNRIRRTKSGRQHGHYGVKGRGGRDIHIHHNTIEVNFSIEFPFEGNERVEIDHNILNGVVSIPKWAGGHIPNTGRSFHIHHNYFTTSYAIEFVRNAVEIDHNLFDFDVNSDGGNLISAFGRMKAPGPAVFHNNLVSNPGRGVIWIKEPYDRLTVRHNHIITRTTVTPREDGLFGLNSRSDFSSIQITDNIIECIGQPRPLLRNDTSYRAIIRNNRSTNVSDSDRFQNPQTDAIPGLEEPLRFQCGVHGMSAVDRWNFHPVN